MNNNYIISAEEFKMEKFNSFVLSVDTLEKFLAYYMLVLQLAYNCEIISRQEREKINNWLLVALAKKTDGKAVLIANIMYVFSFYLLSLSKQKALEELRLICSEDSANQCLIKADKFLKKFISRNNLVLSLIYSNVKSLNNSVFLKVYNELENYLVKLKYYDYDEEINFKEMHNSTLSLQYFSLNQNTKYSNYFEKLENAITSFNYDVKIIKKLKGKELFESNFSLYKELQKKSADELKKFEDKYEAKLFKLKAEYEEKKKAPNADIFSLMKKYEKKRQELLENFSAEEESFLNEKLSLDDFDFKESILFLESEMPSISYIIKEFTLYYMVSKGFCDYPITEAMRLKTIENMDISKAVTLITSAEDIGLTDKEKEYLINTTRKI